MMDTMFVAFDVIGLPAPQGSKRHVGNGVMVESSKNLKPWRDSVTVAAREAQELHGTVPGPVEVSLWFRFPPTKSDPHRHRHAQTPDLDKLIRGVLDALTHSRLITDDKAVWCVKAAKTYAPDYRAIGVTVSLWSHTEDEIADQQNAKELAKAAKRKAAA